MKSLRHKYVREHPLWPSKEIEAIMEITEINDLLDKGGWTKSERNWAYARRRKLQKFLQNESYRAITEKRTAQLREAGHGERGTGGLSSASDRQQGTQRKEDIQNDSPDGHADRPDNGK